jgi:hypothetical protein
MKKYLAAFVLIDLAIIAAIAWAQSVPQLINYQGRLTDDLGQPVNGTVEMRFLVLDADTISATVLWGETQSSVQVTEGIYEVKLGSANPLPPSVLSMTDVYLEVRVNGEILRPRSQLTSVAFAHKAATMPNGAITSAMIMDGEVSSADVGFNYADSYGKGTAATDLFCADCLNSFQIEDVYVFNTTDTMSGDLTLGGDLTVLGNHIGIGTAAAWSYGILNDSGNATNVGIYMYGNNQAVYGKNVNDTTNYGYLGGTDRGVCGLAGSTTSGSRFGGYFSATSGDQAYGVYGYASSYGLEGAYGVRASGINNGTGPAYGGYFNSSAADPTKFDFALYTFGEDYSLFATGGTKSWVNPDPEDPDQAIVYATLEGGENGTYVRGVARLENGKAIVTLPDHFRKVTSPNELITVQVTPRSAESKGLAVTSRSNTVIVVEELYNGSGDYEFDYIVHGIRLGYEDHEPIIDNNDYVPFQGNLADMDESRLTTQEYYDSKREGLKKIFKQNGILDKDGKVNEKLFKEKGWKNVKEKKPKKDER